jgi:hypothetical protein
MRCYFDPESGDYLSVFPRQVRFDPTTGQRLFDGRAPAVQGLPSSVCTCTIGEEYLSGCVRVRRGEVPSRWRRAIR